MTPSGGTPLCFVKMQGLGNDFILLDLRDQPDLPPPDASLARALCDRRFGVGADGLLVIRRGALAPARMDVLNADGSKAEMCGNGLRCVARYLFERGAVEGPRISVETDAGVLACEIHPARHPGEDLMVQVAMGRPRLARGEIPVLGTPGDTCIDQPIEVLGRRFLFCAVGMGNPHAILFFDGDEGLRQLAERYGPEIERQPLFPERTNVEFARLRRSDIDLVVWERGCGITLSCGTGACAAAVAAVVTGRAAAGSDLAVHLPGGKLLVRVARDLAEVHMRGPCHTVFEGEVLPQRLLEAPTRT